MTFFNIPTEHRPPHTIKNYKTSGTMELGTTFEEPSERLRPAFVNSDPTP